MAKVLLVAEMQKTGGGSANPASHSQFHFVCFLEENEVLVGQLIFWFTLVVSLVRLPFGLLSWDNPFHEWNGLRIVEDTTRWP